MRQIVSRELSQPSMGLALGFRLIEAKPKSTVFERKPTAMNYNPIGSVHGGFASTILDSAMACAVHTRLEVGTFYPSIEIKINLVKPIMQITGLFLAQGTVFHCSKGIATAEGRLEDEEGKHYVH